MKIRAILVTFSIVIYGYFYPVLSIAQSGQVQANGITIYYESIGAEESETILLISGTNAQLTMWPDNLCNGLAEHGYRVIRFDNRDIGLSTKFDKAGLPDWSAITKAFQENEPPPLPYTLDDMANDAVGLLNALGIKKAHIVGASMGGMIAQRVAYLHPEHALSLASISAGGGNATFPLVADPEVMNKLPQAGNPNDTTAHINREMQVRTALAGNVYPPDQKKLLREIKADVTRSYYPEDLLRQGAVSMAGFYAGRQEELKTIKIPTIVIHGDQDPLVTLDAGKDVASIIPGADFEIIKGMGHDLPAALTDTLVDLIVENAAKGKESK